MTVPTVIVILGALLFLLGILGGGISLKEVSLPPVSTKLRVVLIPLSVVMMAFGVWLSFGGTIAPPQAPAPQAPQGEPAATPLAPPTLPVPSPTTAVITQRIPHYEQAGALIYEEDFEDGQATGWVTGGMQVIQLPDGNHVYFAEDTFPFFVLPEGVLDYAVEARIMQPAGSNAAAGVGVRAPSTDSCAYYFSYIDFAGGWLNLAENTPQCEENSGPGALRTGYQLAFAQDVWYTLALEASGTTMSVYMDRELVGSGQDDTYRSNILLLWSWSGEPGSHVIYFDDIRIWSLP